MNFFERQAQARRTSTRLVLLFVLAVAAIVLAVDLAVLVFAGPHPGLLALATLGTLAVIGLGSLFRIASLRGGGESVAQSLGGVPVPEDTADPSLRRLRNVVEEIAIASGVPVPKLYVLEHEAGINAFAAGYSTSDAAVAVTRGALDRLNRDELQGVIAHEFSHILNGDMRLNIRLIGVLFGILMLAIIGRKILEGGRGGGRLGRSVSVILVAALLAMLVGYVGLFFGRMIKASVSRTRERLADASAVQFTRQTAGLAGALKKIGGLHEGAKLNDRADAEEISHMLFGDGVGVNGWFATHPPLLERIRALEPSFRADQLEQLSRRWAQEPPQGLQEDRMLGLAAVPPPLPPADSVHALTPPMVAAQVAQPGADDYRRADSIVSTLPDELRALAKQREAVLPLLLALLLDEDAAVAARQRYEIAARLGQDLAEQAVQLRAGALAGLHPMLRLPLAALAFPVLRLRPRPQLESFTDAVQAAVNADGRVSLFEYCLARLLTVQVTESLDPSRHARFGRRKPAAVAAELATLLAVVAQAGHADTAAAQRAYLAGLQRVLPNEHRPYAPPANGVLALDGVWEALDALDPLAKQALVEGVTAAVSHDGRIAVAEAELLRTICAVLHCPLPPMLAKA
ncbi:M48 family metallopeptidase [Lysobacter silvisoli]|uniref:Peptidase M48 Ste24p n=1 Tax=Lysobacter silvisoli TaxID=2293254 RepID=A0A371K6J4_9GAMM|nr:M48 family metallopeptidase [Lysobacter silvisoli]RDZ29470.1 peptidase M48 Ste24p [Lysobacter silvisoli]